MYSSGVYSGEDCDPYWLDHAVVLVGFTDSGSDGGDGGDGDNNDGDNNDGDGDNNDGDNNDNNVSYTVDKWWYYENSPSRRLQDSAG